MHQAVRSIAGVSSTAAVLLVDAVPMPWKAGIPWVDPPTWHLGNPVVDVGLGRPVRRPGRVSRNAVSQVWH